MPTTTAKPTTESPILNVKETAEFLRVSQSLVWNQIKAGTLKPLRIGDRVLFSRVYLERLCESE